MGTVVAYLLCRSNYLYLFFFLSTLTNFSSRIGGTHSLQINKFHGPPSTYWYTAGSLLALTPPSYQYAMAFDRELEPAHCYQCYHLSALSALTPLQPQINANKN